MPNDKRGCSGGVTRLTVAGALCAFLVAPSLNAQVRALIVDQFFPRVTLLEAINNLNDMLVARGVAPDIVIRGSGDDLGDLSDYQCVFDLRIDQSLQPVDDGRYIDYANGGGAMFFIGEHSSFDSRNFSVALLLTSLGAAGVLTDPIAPFPPPAVPIDSPETVNSGHPIGSSPNLLNEVVYDGVENGRFLDVGTGVWLTQDFSTGDIGAAVYDPGRLFSALDARAVFVLDINFLADGPTGTLDFWLDRVTPTENRAFVDNVISYLCLPGCQTWDDLRQVIADSDFDVEGVRHSFDVKAVSACRAHEREHPHTSANVLCALLHETDAQDGKHVTEASADDIRECVRSLADHLDLTLRCDQ